MLKKFNIPLFDFTALAAALVFCYYYYLGETFVTLGNYGTSFAKALGVFIILSIHIIALQRLKGAKKNFKHTIYLERFLLISFLILLAFSFKIFTHYFYVKDQRDIIGGLFLPNIKKAESIYDEYDKQAKGRINAMNGAYDRAIAAYITGINQNPYLIPFRFDPTMQDDLTQKKNKLLVMEQKLYPANYKNIKVNDSLWFAAAREGMDNWDPHLLLETISSIESRTNRRVTDLQNFYRYRADGEGQVNQDSIFRFTANFNSVISRFQTTGTPTFFSISIGVLLILFMSVPYLIKDRDSRNDERLFKVLPNKRRTDKGIDITD